MYPSIDGIIPSFATVLLPVSDKNIFPSQTNVVQSLWVQTSERFVKPSLMPLVATLHEQFSRDLVRVHRWHVHVCRIHLKFSM